MPEPLIPQNFDYLKEGAMITDFQMGPTPEKFENLYNTFDNSIEKSINEMGGLNTPLPRPALKNQATIYFDKALNTFRADSGAKFTTWLNIQMQPLKRFIRDNSDIAHIPDNRVIHVARMRDTVANLSDELGRSPSTQEIADSMRLDVKEIGRLQREMKKDLLVENGLESFMPTQDVEIIEDRAAALMMDLKPQDAVVLEHLLGLYGKPKLTPNQIAKKLDVEQTKVRSSMATIQGKWRTYFGKEYQR
jgi:hypothetical protein